MAVRPGARFGPYEVLGPIGAGGMGEVYRARDTRLERIVAFKVVSSALTNHPGRRQRFQREARAISSLSHPHICALYDVGEEDAIAYLVMEYLDGETLAQRLLRGALPREHMLRRAAESASALDHAHRHGVIHRDLKPSNVMLTTSGAKLLDFGLAKLHQQAAASVLATESIPGAAATGEGTILGTVQYMAPEQLEAKEADARTDVFALGALVFEMATGKKAFEGASPASLVAAILREKAPRISTLVPLMPPALDHVVARCLAKDPDDRWQTMRDVMLELRDMIEQPSGDGAKVGAGRPSDSGPSLSLPDAARYRGREQLAWIAAVVATLVAATIAIFSYVQSDAAIDDLTGTLATGAIRSEIPAPPNTSVGSMALSPDGRRLVFVGRSGRTAQLWIRSLDSLEAKPLAGTDGADYPFWSPDGRSLGFFAEGKLKRVDAAGGSLQTLADAPNTRGGSWSTQGIIIFSPNSLTLHQVAATGGPSAELTKLDPARGEISHRWPFFLPDGQHFLYLAQSSIQDNKGLFVASLDGRTRKLVVRVDVSGAYVAPGYLLFVRNGTLMAQRLRLETFEVEGTAIPLAGPVSVNGLERAQFEVSPAGTLVYRRGAFLGSSEAVWFDRRGQRLGMVGTPADFRGVRISPDGRHIALVIEDQRVGTPDVWIHDIVQNASTRFTFDPGTDRDPVWSPDSGQLAVRSSRNTQFNVSVRAFNGLGGEDLLLDTELNTNPQDWSRDGRNMIFSQVDSDGKTDRDLWILPMNGERKPYPLVKAALIQNYPRFSPSGRWVAYQTNDSGRYKVYVMPFPDSGRKWEISPEGGIQPLWRANGQELFFLAPDNTVMAVDVRETPSTIAFGTPRPLFQAAVTFFATEQPSWSWDVSPDGQRFLIIVSKEEPAPITLVLNWRADLE